MDLQLHAIEPQGLRALTPPEGSTTIHNLLDGLELGVYSALHSWPGGRFFRLDDHFDRTDASMRRLGWSDELDRDRLCGVLHDLCAASPHEQLRLRFDVLAAPGTQLGTYSRLLVASEPHLGVPGAQLDRGVAIGIARDLARHTPLVKTAEWVLARRPYPLGTPEEADHLLLDEHERVLETTSANIFFVRRGALVTAGEGVLEGIVRKVVLELAREMRLPVHFECLALEAAAGCDEAFLTSSTRHVLPVVRIGAAPIGKGLPGPITRALLERYEELAEEQARPAVQ
jgi:branched-chain amino acid aminotransferase